MKFGSMLPVQGPVASVEAIAGGAREAESRGFASVWVHEGHHTRQNNHNFAVCGMVEYNRVGSDPNFFDPIATLSFLSGATKSVKIGCCTIILPLYDLITLAKQMAAIDRFSSGRLIFGVSIGGGPPLAKFFNIRNFKFEERGKIFDEYVRALRALWSDENSGGSSFHGHYISFSNVELYPRPTNQKIYIGASTSPRGIRRLAELADGWLPQHNVSPDQIKLGLQRVKEKAKSSGRADIKLDVIHRTYACIGETSQEAQEMSRRTLGARATAADETSNMLIGTNDQVLSKIKEFQNAGVSHLGIYPIFRGADPEDLYQTIKTFSEKIMSKFDSD